MLRKIIWTLVIVIAIVISFHMYQYNEELKDIISNIKISDVNSIIDKAKNLNEQLSGVLASGSVEISSGTEEIMSGVINTLSGAVAEVTAETKEVVSGAIN